MTLKKKPLEGNRTSFVRVWLYFPFPIVSFIFVILSSVFGVGYCLFWFVVFELLLFFLCVVLLLLLSLPLFSFSFFIHTSLKTVRWQFDEG